MRILCRILPHPRTRALIRFQFKGLPPPSRRRRRQVLAAATCAECTVPTSLSSELAMHADPKGVLTGVHFLDGDHACCEGTLAAGARFAAGYPITPSTEVVERFAWRIPTVGGIFIQMEDELAASIAIQGAVWGGAKAFTVTSGPGFSLMMEHIGYAAMTETPVRLRQRAARRTLHRTPHPARPGRYDAGQVGVARRLQHHRPLPQFSAGVLRPHRHRLQPVRRVPRPRHDDAR